MGLFSLDGDDYWTDPWKNGSDLVMNLVMDLKFGLYLDAPSSIDPRDHDSVPAPFFYVATMRDAFKTDLDAVAKVVAVRVEDRALKIDAALTVKDNRQRETKLGADSDDPTSEQHIVELAKLGILNEPGTYKVNVLVRGKISNRVDVTIENPGPSTDDPEVLKFIEAHRTPPLPPAPASPELVWDLAGAPPVPADEGIAFVVDRVVLHKPGARSLLKGAFRLKARRAEIVPPASEATLERPHPEYGEPRPTAIVPITLVCLGTVDDAPVVLKLRVPSFDKVAAEGDAITGQFAIDLLADKNLRARPQTFSIYGFAGEPMTGPHTFATVTETMLPKPGQ
jgi:hypothetical protein